MQYELSGVTKTYRKGPRTRGQGTRGQGIVTHDRAVAASARRTGLLRDGRLSVTEAGAPDARTGEHGA